MWPWQPNGRMVVETRMLRHVVSERFGLEAKNVFVEEGMLDDMHLVSCMVG